MAKKYYHTRTDFKNTREWYEETTKQLRNHPGVEKLESTALFSSFRLIETNTGVRVYNLYQQPRLAAAPIEMEFDPRLAIPSENALRTIIGELQEYTP